MNVKTVVNTSEVAHLWANQAQEWARNAKQSLYFHGGTIYSYGAHFAIARHVTRKGAHAVLFTTRDYSVTTKCHKNAVRGAIPPGIRVFHVDDVTATHPSLALADYAKRIEEAETAAKRSRRHKLTALHHLAGLIEEAKAYTAFFGLKHRFTFPEGYAEAVERAERGEAVARAEKHRLNAERMEQRERQYADAVEQWKRGEIPTLPYLLKTYLRIEGEELVTSKGARVELAKALRLLPFIRAGRMNGSHLHAGPYKVQSIDEQGNVQIGCHYIERDEIERITSLVSETRRTTCT